MKKGEAGWLFSRRKRKGFANSIQLVVIIITVIALAVIVGFFVNKSISEGGSTIDAQRIVLDSEFKITSAASDGETLNVRVKKEKGDNTFPTVVVYDPGEKTASKGSQDLLGVYQTANVMFSVPELESAGFAYITKVAVYASALDKQGRVVNSKNPKDVKMISYELMTAPTEECGDGELNDGEECDDNNNYSCDGCAGDCSRVDDVCGDGVVECGEECDDNGLVSGDGCDSNCEIEDGWICLGQPSVCSEICGDDLVVGEEYCDDGDNGCDYYPGCNAACSDVLECGNSDIECDEDCDDGANGDDSDECYDDCEFTYCGDGIIQTPNGEGVGGPGGNGNENCDGGQLGGVDCLTVLGYTFTGGNLGCSVQCIFDVSGCTSSPTCGNNNLEAGEACDDGNTNDCDGCAGDCSHYDNVCGDGIWECDEVCDDHNNEECDGCAGDCSRVDDVCGDGVVECGEECEDPEHPDGSEDDCSDLCMLTYCGDGIIQTPNGKGDGYQDGMEECDDGFFLNSDTEPGACRSNCRNHYCGDGVCDQDESGGGDVMFAPYSGHSGASGGRPGGNEEFENEEIEFPDAGNCPQDCGGSGEWGIVINEEFLIIY